MSAMTENLLRTLDALSARDESVKTATEPMMRPGVDYNPETGEWLGDRPEGYEPIVAPEIKIEHKETKVQEFENTDARTDYIRIRETTYAMQEATIVMMTQAAKLAAATEAPRAFSVFRELGDLMRGLNKDLMDNMKNFKAVTQGEQPNSDDELTVNVQTHSDGTSSVTVGKGAKRSSRDLLKVIEGIRDAPAKNEEEVVDAEIVEVVEEPQAVDEDKAE